MSTPAPKPRKHQPVNVGYDTFQTVVLDAGDTPVLVDFWAPWCGPCRVMSPVLAELAAELGDRVVVAKVNVDDEPELAQAGRIKSIPTLVVFHRGQVVDAMIGAQPKERLHRAVLQAERKK